MRYVREELVEGVLQVTAAVEVAAGETFAIPAGQIWRPGDEEIGSIVPAPPPAPAQPRLVPPVAVPRAFVTALGAGPGMEAWAEVQASTHPAARYWLTELAMVQQVDVDYPGLAQALALLLTIDGGDGQPILAAGQDAAILAALQAMAG